MSGKMPMRGGSTHAHPTLEASLTVWREEPRIPVLTDRLGQEPPKMPEELVDDGKTLFEVGILLFLPT